MRLKILGTEVALPTTQNTATTLGGATEVRLVHDSGGNSPHLVTINNGESSPTTVATFTMVPGETLVIRKLATQKIWASNDDIKAVKVSYQS